MTSGEAISGVNLPPLTSYGTLERGTATSYKRLALAAKRGEAIRLAAGLYVEGALLPPEQLAHHHLFAIIAEIWPGGVISGRSAFGPKDNPVYVAHTGAGRRSPLVLPGVIVIPWAGPGWMPGDVAISGGIYLAGPARRLVENVDVRGRPGAWRAGTDVVEDHIDELARTDGAGGVQEVLRQLDLIAEFLDPGPVEAVRLRLRAVLGSFTTHPDLPSSGRLGARHAGVPYDAHRLGMLERLMNVIRNRSPRPVPEGNSSLRWTWQPFFEAYFSNFIEGTEFGVDEARHIAVDGFIPGARPADAHDVIATYRLAVDNRDRITIPRSGNELVNILKSRHALLMAARPDKQPGQFKTVPNFAGGYEFVEPRLVIGTLTQGFEMCSEAIDPFARAVAMMVLITECHPFLDGNGRVARLCSNSELSAAGEVRYCIPTVYRNDYLAALNGFSNGNGAGESLISVLEFAQRWTAAVSWENYDEARSTVAACNAFQDPGIADRTGVRLLMPARHSG